MGDGMRFRPVIRVFASSTFSDLKAERSGPRGRIEIEQCCLSRLGIGICCGTAEEARGALARSP